MIPEKFVATVNTLLFYLLDYDLQPREQKLCDEIADMISDKLMARKRREEYGKIMAEKNAP